VVRVAVVDDRAAVAPTGAGGGDVAHVTMALQRRHTCKLKMLVWIDECKLKLLVWINDWYPLNEAFDRSRLQSQGLSKRHAHSADELRSAGKRS
jgi:hypothetical protein